MTDKLQDAAFRAADRVAKLRAENVMMTNAIQNAQYLIATGKHDEANKVLTDVINKLLAREVAP